MLKNYRQKLDDIENNLLQMIADLIKADKCMLEQTKKREYAFDECQKHLKNIDTLAFDVDNDIVSTLALFSPEARDLRELVSILKITNELARAKSSIKNFGLEIQPIYEKGLFSEAVIDKIVILQESSIKSLEYVEMMLETKDESLYQKFYNAILAEEDKADELYSMIDKNVIDDLPNDKEKTVTIIEALKTIRKLEKITDRAVGVGDLIMFAQEGGEITH